MKIEYITYWQGKKIDTLSRKELLEVIQWLGNQYQEYMSPEAMKERRVGRMEMFKQGLKK